MTFKEINAIPVDQAALGLTALEVYPSNDGDGDQKADREGVPLWLVACYGKNPLNGQLQTVEVKIAADKAPTIPIGTPVMFKNLVARPWTFDGRGGISVSAEDVAPRGQQQQPAAAR